MEDDNADRELMVEISRSLLDDGRIPEGCMATFWTEVEERLCAHGGMWEAECLRLMHFVSMYAPIRYETFSLGSGKRDPETEMSLSEISLRIEMTLWTAAVATNVADLANEDSRLADLVFEGAVRLHSSRLGLREWEQNYISALREFGARWQGSLVLPPWPTMAIRFASFYLDFLLLGDSGWTPPMDESQAQEELLGRIARRASLTVARTVAAWFAGVKLRKDHGGTPKWGKNTNPRLNTLVRTSSELALFGKLGHG